MQLCRLADQSSRKYANADGGQQIGVVLSLLQPSDVGLSGVKDHSFGHAGWQGDLDFNVEFSSEHVFGRDIKDSVDEANREPLVLFASEEHFEGVIDGGG